MLQARGATWPCAGRCCSAAAAPSWPARMWAATAASQSGLRASRSTRITSKRDSSGPDSAVHSASGARGSRRGPPLGFVTPSTVVRVDSVVTCPPPRRGIIQCN